MRVRFLHHFDAIVHEEANGRRMAPRSLTVWRPAALLTLERE
ncbi:hypothetical protein [Azospirillum endophyticum]